MLFARFSINLKLLVLSTLPLLVLVAFLSREGKLLYDTKQNSYQTQAIIELALKLDNIAHQHATERGLTEGFLNGDADVGKNLMLEQRKKSDNAVSELKRFVYTRKNDLNHINLRANELIKMLKQKSVVREKVDLLSVNNNSFSYYSLVNKNAIDTIDLLVTLIENVSLRNELNNMVAMLWLKERAGQSRGALNGVYAKGMATPKAYADIHSYISHFDHTLELLINNRRFHTKAALVESEEMPFSAQIIAFQNDFLAQSEQLNNIQGPKPEQWFPLATQRIEAISAIVNDQAIYTLSESKKIRAHSTYYLIIGSLIMLVVLSALIFLSYYISLNISSRIHNINRLLTVSMNSSDLSIQIEDQGNDEVTRIADGINSYINWQRGNLRDAKNTSSQHEYLANHDSLTKLANRSLFFSRLTHLVKQLERYDRHHAILYIDLDFFKSINDEYGHILGDKVLQAFAKKLLKNIREIDTAARLGGDEFGIILEEVTEDQAHLLSQKLLADMKKPLLIDALLINISVSIGMTFFPNEGTQDPITLLKQADHALYDAKRSGRQQYRYFNKTLKRTFEETTQLESDLRYAIDKLEIFPHFQAQYCLKTQKIIGVEALARWHHPEKGIIPPNKFIPIAEKLSLMTVLTESIINQAGENLVVFMNIERYLKMAINILDSDCSNPHILHLTQRLIDDNSIKPEQIELEIKESGLVEYPQSSIAMLTALHDLGITIAIDDFGTGYSSLNYLTSLPISILKIDMCFVQGIGVNPQQEIVIQVIIDLAKRLSLKVIAEGIETQAQADFLVDVGCDYGQGYFYSKPCSPQDIIKLLEGKQT